jgi:hypothetical protein
MNSRTATLRAAFAIATLALAGCHSQSDAATSRGASNASSGSSAPTSTAAVNWTTTSPMTVTDSAVNMPAFTIQIPSSWKFAGMMLRPGGCHAPAVPADGLSFTALAPDGITSYEELPGVSWAWASDGTNPTSPRCPAVNITSAAAFLLNIVVPNMRPDATNISVIPLPQAMQAGLEAQQRTLQAKANANLRQILDAARIRLSYQLNGHPVEELIGAVITCNESTMPAYPQLHRPASTRRFCQSNSTNIRRAPQGALDAMIAKNLPAPQINPAWDSLMQQQMRTNFAKWQKANDAQFQAIQDHYKQVTAGMVQRAQAAMAQLQDQTNAAMAQDRATQSAIDHAAQGQVRDSLNRQIFVDPTTGQKIETSNQFTSAWINSDRSGVALTSDRTADQNGTVDPVRQSWTELIPTGN